MAAASEPFSRNAAIRRFGLAYLPDTCFRPFVLLAGILLLIAAGVTLTAANVTALLTVVFVGLALVQYLLLRKDIPHVEAVAGEVVTGAAVVGAAVAPPRLVKLWRREATPLILVALFTYFFADLDILIVTPLLPSAETAIVGLSLKLALLVGFAVQVAHQVVVPDLADAHARKEHGAIRHVAVSYTHLRAHET